MRRSRQFEVFSLPLSFYTIDLNVILENEFLRFLSRKVPTVTPIETKQEQVRSDHERGSYRDEMKAVTNPFPPSQDSLCTVRDLLREPDLPVEEGDESSMEGLVPCEAPAERRGSRTRKDKHIIVDDDAGDGGCFPDNILEDYLNSDEQFDLEELLGYGGPAADGGTRKGSEFSKALRMVNGEARMAQFKAETPDREIAHLREELECSRRREGRSTATEIRRVHRQGKREMVKIMKSCRAQLSCEFGEFKKSYQALGDYRECRGAVGRLYLSQIPGYSFAAEDAKKTWCMKERDKDFALPQIEERIWKQWEPIPVSPDTVEAETGVPDETGELNQPTAPLDVSDYSIGGSMTGYYEFDG
ncbi:hypothetical protein F2Q69_00023789 [Brassica cretica]|uniref:Uncharacterized protein n=1 Tax=Brassica cretica TaxID=69181 RepID=A0A8S9QCK8_BRACR|nr:hypothetical protein F2Q69_00023789 [Brassica cretica]